MSAQRASYRGECGSLRSTRSRATSIAETGRDRSDQTNPGRIRIRSATAQVRRFDRRRELVRVLSLARVVVIAGEDRTIEEAAHACVGRRVDPGAQGEGDVVDGDLERRLGREGLHVQRLDPVQCRPDPKRFDQRVEPDRAARSLGRLSRDPSPWR